jgi:hypothetical protein
LDPEDLKVLKRRTNSLKVGMYPENAMLPMPQTFVPGKILHIEKIRRPQLNLKDFAIDAARGARDAVKAAGEKLKDNIIDGAEKIIDGAEGIKEKIIDGAEGISEGIKRVVTNKPRSGSVATPMEPLRDHDAERERNRQQVALRSKSVGDLRLSSGGSSRNYYAGYESDDGGLSMKRRKKLTKRRSSARTSGGFSFRLPSLSNTDDDLERGTVRESWTDDDIDREDYDEAPSRTSVSSYKGMRNVKSLEAIYHEKLKGGDDTKTQPSPNRKRPSVTFAEMKLDGALAKATEANNNKESSSITSSNNKFGRKSNDPLRPPAVTITVDQSSPADFIDPLTSSDPDHIRPQSQPSASTPQGSPLFSPLTPAEEMKLSKPIYPPSYAVKKGGVPRAGPVPRRNGKYHYIPRWAQKEEFSEVVVSRSMVADHFPFELLREVR